MLAIRAIVGQRFADRFPELIPYRQYLTEIGLDITIFAAILCPELLCPDRRDNVLSLYLSTAVGRFTYVVGKFLAALVPLLCLTLLPVLLLFVGNTFFADSATGYLADHWHDSLRIVASGLLLASYVSLVGLAVASFTSRRAFALGGYAALMLIPTFVGGSLVGDAGLDRHLQLIMLGRLPIAAARSLYGGEQNPEFALAGWWWWSASAVVMAISAGCLWWRYRRADALTLVFQGVSKWYGDTVALAEVSFELDARRDRPARPQRRGQVHGARPLRRLRRSEHRHRARARLRSAPRARGLPADRHRARSRRPLAVPHGARAGRADGRAARRARSARGARAEALASVGLEDAAERRVGGFSKGMRQRVKLAQALVHSPELLLLDEPLNGLDPVQRRHVVELIRRLGAEGRTVLVSSHVLHEVERMAPRVVVLVNGRLVAEGETARSATSYATGRARCASPPARRRRRWRASWSARASRAACASTTACSSSRRPT